MGTRSPLYAAFPVTGIGSVNISEADGGPFRFLAVSLPNPEAVADVAIPNRLKTRKSNKRNRLSTERNRDQMRDDEDVDDEYGIAGLTWLLFPSLDFLSLYSCRFLGLAPLLRPICVAAHNFTFGRVCNINLDQGAC